MVRNKTDLLTGLLFLVLAALFAWQSLQLPLGVSGRIGSGYFPLALSGLLGFFGLLVLGRACYVQGALDAKIAWRPLILIIAACLIFAFGLLPFGFVPALSAAVLIASLASQKFRTLPALLLTVALVAFCWLVFVWGLGLQIPLLGTLFNG